MKGFYESSVGDFLVFFLLVVLPSACHGKTTSREVVIYLANETAPVDAEQRNYETVIEWLNSDKSPKTERLVASLSLDRVQFQVAVGLEVSDFTLEVPKQATSAGLLIVTNRLFRSGQCLLWKREFDQVRETELSVAPSHDNFILAANPLSRPDMVTAVLSFAAQQFDPHQHGFVLIFKSHGSDAKVITPRLAVRSEETNRDEILRIANNHSPEDEFPQWTDRLGITKTEFFNVLRDAGSRHGMNFSLVFLEACNTSKHRFSSDELPENVDRLLLIEERANYLNVLYADVIQQQDQAGSFSETLLADLPEKFTLIDRNRRVGDTAPWWQWPRIGYFIPFAFWLMWVTWRVSRRSALPLSGADNENYNRG